MALITQLGEYVLLEVLESRDSLKKEGTSTQGREANFNMAC